MAFAAVLVGRIVSVYLGGLVIRFTDQRIPLAWQHVLVWGGLRGSVALALVLSLPVDFPFRSQIVIMTFGVVLFSLLGQGLTMRPLLRWFGLTGRGTSRADFERLTALLLAERAAIEELDRLLASGIISARVHQQQRNTHEQHMQELEDQIDKLHAEVAELEQEQGTEAALRAVQAQRYAVQSAFAEGLISREVQRDLLSDIDREYEQLMDQRQREERGDQPAT